MFKISTKWLVLCFVNVSMIMSDIINLNENIPDGLNYEKKENVEKNKIYLSNNTLHKNIFGREFNNQTIYENTIYRALDGKSSSSSPPVIQGNNKKYYSIRYMQTYN